MTRTILAALLFCSCRSEQVDFPGDSAPGDEPIDTADCAQLWYGDGDGDGYGDDDELTASCQEPSGYVATGGDCDDQDSEVHPDAEELCDGLDNDCDGQIDEQAPSWYADADGDGYGDPDAAVQACEAPEGCIADASDCDDAEAASYPGAPEICDGLRNDCDGEWNGDEGLVNFVATDGTVSDLSATFAVGTKDNPVAHTVAEDGELRFCAGTWYTNIEVTAAQVSLWGPIGADETVLDGCGAGSVVEQSHEEGGLELEGLTITGGVAEERGGGVLAPLNLTVTACRVVGNESAEKGGGVNACQRGQHSPCVVVIEDSLFQDNAATSSGGGMNVGVGSLRISDSEISSNGTEGSGAGVYLNIGEIVVENSLFEGNTAGGYGGGAILIAESSLVITDSVFINNAATSTRSSYGRGGAIDATGYMESTEISGTEFVGNTARYGAAMFLDLGTLTITDSVFQDNVASKDAGALDLDEVALTMEACHFEGNTAEGDAGAIGLYYSKSSSIEGTSFLDSAADEDGGAIYVWYGQLEVMGSSFSGNHSLEDGGSIYGRRASITARSSSFEHGSATEDGGAIYAYESNVMVEDSSFLGNQASEDGGAIYGDQVWAYSSIFQDNSAAQDGGAIYGERDIGLYDTLLQDNQALQGGGVALQGGTVSCYDYSPHSDTKMEVGFLRNSATMGGAVYVYEGDVISYSCSWGEDKDTNTPVDLWVEGTTADYGDDAEFTCSAEGC